MSRSRNHSLGYDVKLGDKKGRVCTIKNVDVQEGIPVIVREQDLASCTR